MKISLNKNRLIGGFIWSSSKATSTDQRTSATDDAQVARDNAVIANPYSAVLTGANAKLSVTTTSVDPKVVAAALGTVEKTNKQALDTAYYSQVRSLNTVKDLGAQFNQTAGEVLENQSDLVDDVLGNQMSLVKSVLTSEQDTLGKILDNTSSLTSSTLSQFGNLASSLVSKVTDLAESKQTGGESGRNQIVLYAVLAVAAVFALLAWRKP